MSRDESLPIGTVTRAQIHAAKETAAALELAEIEARAERVRAHPNGAWEPPITAQADRARLLELLREERAEAQRLRELAATGIGITARRRLAEDPVDGPLPYVVSLGEAWLTTKGAWERPATSRDEDERSRKHRRFYFYGVEAALAAATAAIGREPDCAEWMR